ncbi:GNAT family N-acetyltransferase/peptidase C39 family protein [Aliihoeflea sp. PC F10.4]
MASAPTTIPGIVLRPARSGDESELATLEARVFEHDRISRRSFHQLIERPTAETMIAQDQGVIVGYAMVLFRKGSGVARLYSLAVDPEHGRSGLGRTLLAAAEHAAYEHGRMLLRLEVREDNPRAIALYEKNHYRRIGIEKGYYEDGVAAIRMEKLLRGEIRSTKVPFYEQTADFTCGPCCLMMAMARFDPEYVPDPVNEIRLWRDATTIFMMSGPGGCEPFGMAVAAHENGIPAEIFVSQEGPLFLQSVRNHEKRRVMQLAQIDFRARIAKYGVPVRERAFVLEDIRKALKQGRLVMVLISGFLMFGKKVPHWVLAIDDDGDHIFIHDPWVEDEHGETAADAANVPVPYEMFMRMAQFGQPALRAAVMLGDRKRK